MEIFFEMLFQTKRTGYCIRGGKNQFYLLLSAHKAKIKVQISSSPFLPPKKKKKTTTQVWTKTDFKNGLLLLWI